MWGRTEEGGRAVVRNNGAAAHPIISSAIATPQPLPAPTRGGGCANGVGSIEMQQALASSGYFRST
jgi:hypothetical protein